MRLALIGPGIMPNPPDRDWETSGSNYQADLAAYSTGQTMDKSIGFTKS